jgi:hypothetical protein
MRQLNVAPLREYGWIVGKKEDSSLLVHDGRSPPLWCHALESKLK